MFGDAPCAELKASPNGEYIRLQHYRALELELSAKCAEVQTVKANHECSLKREQAILSGIFDALDIAAGYGSQTPSLGNVEERLRRITHEFGGSAETVGVDAPKDQLATVTREWDELSARLIDRTAAYEQRDVAQLRQITQHEKTIASLQRDLERSGQLCAESEKIRDNLADRMIEMEATFDLQWDASQRAIKMWQDAGGDAMTWPDRAHLLVWLMERVVELEKALTNLLTVSENADETGYVDGEGWLDIDKIQQEARKALARKEQP